MAIISIPESKTTISDVGEIRKFMTKHGLYYDQWEPQAELGADASQDEILAAFSAQLGAFMKEGGYKTADVISVYPETPNLLAIRNKFLAEHTHTEDEIRYFVEGQGLFWFNLEGGAPVFSILCERSDIISVPAGTKHWFDLGPEAHVRAIRIFTDESGWVANYTGSKIDERYNPNYA